MIITMDGLSMIRALREEGVTTPILLAISVSKESIEQNPHQLYDAYLKKPYSEGDMLEAIRALLEPGDNHRR